MSDLDRRIRNLERLADLGTDRPPDARTFTIRFASAYAVFEGE